MSYIGKTRIEMRNVHTGQVEKVEHGNVFRGENIQRYLKTFGCFCNAYTSSYATIDLWKDVVGGILLLDDEVPTNSGIIPAGIGMIGNGAYQLTNNTDPVELGTWNETESSISADGNTLTMVYDWGTSQGNGTIASVCLTSYTAGYIGIGNKSKTHLLNPGTYITMRRNTIRNYGNDGRFLYGGNRQILSTSVSGAELTLTYRDLWGANAILVPIEKTATVTIQEATGTDISFVYQLNDTEIALFRTQKGVTFTKLYVDRVNVNTWAVTSNLINNTTGEDLRIIGQTTGGLQYYMCGLSDNEILILNAGGTDHYALNIDTGVFTLIQLAQGYAGSLTSFHRMLVNDNLIILRGTVFDSSETSIMYMYDRINETVYPINLPVSYFTGGVYVNQVGGIELSNGNVCSNPFYLATVNNLDEPVIKDFSKSMKVIYTLQKVS